MDEDLMAAAARIAAANAREAFVLDDGGHLVGLLAEADVARSYVARASRAEDTVRPMAPGDPRGGRGG
jgi:CBS domain-containing protein